MTATRPLAKWDLRSWYELHKVYWVLVPDPKYERIVREMCLMRCEGFDDHGGRLLMRDVDDACCWWPAARVIQPSTLGLHASEGRIRQAMRKNGMYEGSEGATDSRDCRDAWERMYKCREERKP